MLQRVVKLLYAGFYQSEVLYSNEEAQRGRGKKFRKLDDSAWRRFVLRRRRAFYTEKLKG